MKRLSLKQPYLGFLVSDKKTIESRTRNTNLEKFLIHASTKLIKQHQNIWMPIISHQIIGTAVLYDAKEYINKTGFEKDINLHNADFCKYGFLIRNAQRLPTCIHYPARLKFSDVSYKGRR
jgi:hypothetical protein